MRKVLYLLSVILFVNTVSAQKKIEKSFRNQNIKTIHLELDHVFSITIRTLRTNEVNISAESEGEFASYFNLEAKETQEILSIKSTVDFTFKDTNDKLSAHKVQAISLIITIPEDIEVTLKSDIGNLELHGSYEDFTAQLTSGNCTINHIRGQIKISTIMGNITAFTNYTTIEADTRQGLLNIEEISSGKSTYVLKSIKGDITVKNKK